MKKVISMMIIVMLLGTQLVFASNIGITSSSAVGVKAADPVANAKLIIKEFQDGDIKDLMLKFDDKVKEQLPEDKASQIWGTLLSSCGKFEGIGDSKYAKSGEYDIVVLSLKFEKVNLDAVINFNADGKIVGFNFTPSKNAVDSTIASAAKANNGIVETNVTVGKGEWALPGTLSMPKGKGPFAVVILVHGSGPNDRDETIGPNKPFRDIAWSLASQGIAVLRYDKRTYVYGQKLSKIPGGITVKEETIDDVLEAVKLMQQTKGINKNKIFVLGHSLGGMLIPRIGLAAKNAAGLIVMAGPNRPLEDLMLEQEQYLLPLNKSVSAADVQQTITIIKKQIDNIKNLKSGSKLTEKDLLGAPASYWLDLKGYVPADTAKKLKQPMLILQGERDYQVTMKDFNIWKSKLSKNKNVTFKTYSDLNHLFMTGKGKSTSDEYNVLGHVSDKVLKDIISWVKSK